MTEKQNNIVFFSVLGIAGFALFRAFQKFGLIKSQADIQNEADARALDSGAALDPRIVNPKNPAASLNPQYWLAILKAYQTKKGIKNIDQKQFNAIFNPDFSNGKGYHQNLTDYATQVWDSKKVFFLPDKEDSTYNVFRKLRNQAQVSKLAATFSELYKRDLLGFIQSFMNDEQQAKLYAILKSKPLVN